MVVSYIGIEERMIEGESRFNFVPNSGVESFLCWSKTINGRNIEKCEGYHPTIKLECINQTFLKLKSIDEHIGIIL